MDEVMDKMVIVWFSGDEKKGCGLEAWYILFYVSRITLFDGCETSVKIYRMQTDVFRFGENVMIRFSYVISPSDRDLEQYRR
jgi:hypothetical protein